MAKLNDIMSRLRLDIAVPQSAQPDGNEKEFTAKIAEICDEDTFKKITSPTFERR